MPEQLCPACGEREKLRGKAVDGQILITCERCGSQWARGGRRCKRCGRPGGAGARQQMTRHPRGTLTSVIGVRQTVLCEHCDSAMYAAAVQGHRPVPEDYISRFLFGEPSSSRRAKQPPVGKEREVAIRQAPPATRPPSPPDELPATAQPARRAPKEPIDPTLRQATQAFLTDAGSSNDALFMLLLAGRLGPSTHLSQIDDDQAVRELRQWADQGFGRRADQREYAVAVLRRVFVYWRDRGWLSDARWDGGA